MRALEAAERADIALVLIDASEGLAEGDLVGGRRGPQGRLRDAGRALQVGHHDGRRWTTSRERLGGKLRQRPAIVTTSALTGRNVDRMLDAVEELFDRYTSRVGTGRAEPRDGRDRRRPRAAAQGPQAAEPAVRHPVPHAAAAVSYRRQRPALVTRDYAYFVENQLRRRLGLEGCPVIIDFKSRS